jgi:hypothetical protein
MLNNTLFTIPESSLEQNLEDLKIKEIGEKLTENAYLDAKIKDKLKEFLTNCKKDDFNSHKRQLKNYLCQVLDIIIPQEEIKSPLHSRRSSIDSIFSVGSFESDVDSFEACLYYLCFKLNDQKIGYRTIMSEIHYILKAHLSSEDDTLLFCDSKECITLATTMNQPMPTTSEHTNISIKVDSPTKTAESKESSKDIEYNIKRCYNFDHLKSPNITPRSPARKRSLQAKDQGKSEADSKLLFTI